MPILVKVAQLGARVVEVYLDDGAVLEDALGVAEVDAEGMDVRINGRKPVEEDGEVKLLAGDVVSLIPNIQGG